MFRIIIGTVIVLGNIAWFLFLIRKSSKLPVKKRLPRFQPSPDQIRKGYYNENFEFIGNEDPEDEIYGTVYQKNKAKQDNSKEISNGYTIDSSTTYESGVIPSSTDWD